MTNPMTRCSERLGAEHVTARHMTRAAVQMITLGLMHGDRCRLNIVAPPPILDSPAAPDTSQMHMTLPDETSSGTEYSHARNNHKPGCMTVRAQNIIYLCRSRLTLGHDGNDGHAKMSESKTEKAEQRTQEAEKRTDWAEDRTILANERTFNSWMSVGLGAVGVAIALRAVFGEFDPKWAAKLVASAFLITALLIYWSAWRQAVRALNRLDDYDSEPMPTRNFTVVTIVMTVATLGTGVILWSL